MTVVPNLQIGSLNPQTDEDGGDAYPVPLSGMVVRGARVYASNGCVYCHSQQVRPEYGGSDIERHWGERRSAPRDYIFEPIVFLGKMRIGPDLANVGHQPAVEENKPATPPSAPAAGASPAAAAAQLLQLGRLRWPPLLPVRRPLPPRHWRPLPRPLFHLPPRSMPLRRQQRHLPAIRQRLQFQPLCPPRSRTLRA